MIPSLPRPALSIPFDSITDRFLNVHDRWFCHTGHFRWLYVSDLQVSADWAGVDVGPVT
jgi:hypothetical protein